MAEASVSSADPATASNQESSGTSCAGKPTCVKCLAMAGTGKTTFIQVLLVMSHTAFTCGYIVLMLITHQRVTAHLHSVKSPPYVINLDPAVHHVPYPANIGDQLNTLLHHHHHHHHHHHLSLCLSFTDIRDTVKYKQVMSQYGLGPNGGIVTSLNLFSTRFDQVMGFIEERAPECKYTAMLATLLQLCSMTCLLFLFFLIPL